MLRFSGLGKNCIGCDLLAINLLLLATILTRSVSVTHEATNVAVRRGENMLASRGGAVQGDRLLAMQRESDWARSAWSAGVVASEPGCRNGVRTLRHWRELGGFGPRGSWLGPMRSLDTLIEGASS